MRTQPRAPQRRAWRWTKRLLRLAMLGERRALWLQAALSRQVHIAVFMAALVWFENLSSARRWR